MRTDARSLSRKGENAKIATSILAWTDARFAQEQARMHTGGGFGLLASPAGDPPRESPEFQLAHTDYCPSGAVSCFTQGQSCPLETQDPSCPTNDCTMETGCGPCGDTEWGCSTQVETCTEDC